MAEKRTSKRDEEEEYFQREDAEKKAKIRRQRQLEALQQQERAEIARTLETSEEIAEEAMELGFDAETARVLPLVPMIQIAWADGKVTRAENAEVEAKAAQFGVHPDTAAHDFLELLLDEEPSDLFFERVNQVIHHIVDEDPGGDIRSNVLDWSKAVAEASGGFFGMANPISKAERKILDEFAELFGVD